MLVYRDVKGFLVKGLQSFWKRIFDCDFHLSPLPTSGAGPGGPVPKWAQGPHDS